MAPTTTGRPTTKQKTVGVVWAAFLLATACYLLTALSSAGRFESSILNLLPNSVAEQLNTSNDQAQLDRKFLLLVNLNGNESALISALTKQLEATNKVSFQQEAAANLAAVEAFYAPYRQQLLSPAQRQALRTQSPQQLAEQAYFSLLNPFGSRRIADLKQDPFNLAGDWFASIASANPKLQATSPPSIVEGSDTWFILAGNLLAEAFDPAVQEALVSVLETFQSQHPAVEILRSGLVFHAAEATALSKREIFTVGAGSLLAVLVLVLTVFASYQAILAIVFTLTTSVVVAVSTCLLIFGQINLITLAFGATLLGLAVDYCFHFIIKYRQSYSSTDAVRAIRKGLVLSALSSIAAYLLQLFTPMVGLQQFATFMCAGLATSAINILLLGVLFREPSRQPRRAATLYSAHIAALYQTLARFPKAIGALLLVGVLSLSAITFNKGNEDHLAAFNSSSAELLAAEEKVRTMLATPGTQRFLKVTADSSEALLERSAEVAQAITQDPLLAASKPTTVIGHLAPSQRQQQADYALIQRAIYGKHGALNELCLLLNDNCIGFKQAQQKFAEGLTPERLPASLSSLFPSLMLGHSNEAVIFFETPPAPALLRSITQANDVEYIDQTQLISDALTSYRENTRIALAVFLAVFSVVALYLYKGRAKALLVTLVVVVTAGLSGATGGLSLFHWLALLLVIGLTVDMAIFYIELGLNNATWLASSMSAATSIIAFGLLSFSQVPVLQHFGSVVFWGLLTSWLLTPLIFEMYQTKLTSESRYD